MTTLKISQISVKLYAELSAAALKAKHDKELALWYELRCLTSCGKLPFNDVMAVLVPEHSQRCYSKATLYRLLRSGDGLFWRIWQADKLHPEVRVEYFGLCRVARLLGVDYLSNPREVPLSAFIGRKGKRAQLYSSFHKPVGFRKAKPISRASLVAITGVSRRSQIRYDKVAGNKRVANFAFHDDGKGGFVPILESRPGKTKEYLTVRRLGNIYHSKAMIAPRGMVERVNDQLKQGSLEDKGPRLQRFFYSAKSLVQCRSKDPEPFLMVSPWERLIKGRLEWSLA